MNAAEMPVVVACVPAWQAAGFIERTIATLQAQDYPRLKILISDDASTDDTVEKCAALAATDSRIRVLRQERRLGWVGNCNALLRAAEGKFGLFAPHDDELLPDAVRKLVEVLTAKPRASLAFGDVEMVESDGRRWRASYPWLDGLDSAEARVRRLAGERPRGNIFVPYRGLFPLEVARAIGGLKARAGEEFAADWLWLVELALRGEVVRVPEILFVKHRRRGSLSDSWRGIRVAAQRAAAARTCAGIVSGAELRMRTKLYCYAALAVETARECGLKGWEARWAVYGRVQAAWRR